MGDYRISSEAKDDLIRIHQYGIERFGMRQADKYFDAFFDHFDRIAASPYSFDSVDFIKHGCRRCPCGSDTVYFRIREGTVEIMTIIGQQDLRKLR